MRRKEKASYAYFSYMRRKVYRLCKTSAISSAGQKGRISAFPPISQCCPPSPSGRGVVEDLRLGYALRWHGRLSRRLVDHLRAGFNRAAGLLAAGSASRPRRVRVGVVDADEPGCEAGQDDHRKKDEVDA